MSLFPSIFREKHPIRQRMLYFGRFNDNYKPDENYIFWQNALELNDELKYLESIEQVLKYLTIPETSNCSYIWADGQIHFTFYQGSKIISGVATNDFIKVSAKIARVLSLEVGFMQMLLTSNYDLNFSRFCIDGDGDLSINFDSFIQDASPFKVFYGLKELSVRADKLDDLLVDQYQVLDPINTGHVRQLPEELKTYKYEYFKQETERILEIITDSSDELSVSHGGLSYLVLSHLYSMDYLLRPEGFLMESIERIHRLFFAEDGRSFEQKNAKLLQSLRALLDRSSEQYKSEFYNSVFTFGRMQEGSYKNLRDVISNELIHMDWYYENGLYDYAMAIPKYIASYCLFYFEIGDPGRAFLSLYMEIICFDFVSYLDDIPSYFKKGELQHKVVKHELKQILNTYTFSAREINNKLDLLDFSDLPSFSKTYFSMLSQLNF